MLERLRGIQGHLDEDVAEAMSVVPRHVFVPQVSLERAYGPGPVVTHRDERGVAISSASAAGTVAGMLEQAQVRPGHRVLEIGSGTGYNAALLAHLVGPAGAVTTIEYDAQVADSARQALSAHDAEHVKVITGDGTLGSSEDGPFDRILVTAGAWDIPSAWRDQLAPHGRLVLPLRLRGLTRVAAFERDGEALRSLSVAEDGFIPMQGIGAVAEQNVSIGPGPDLTLRVDDGQPMDTGALAKALDQGPEIIWTAVSAPWAWTENLDFWLATLPGFCRIFVDQDAVAAGRIPRPKDSWGGSWGVFSAGSVAYLTARRTGGTDEMPMLEAGACGFGPDGANLARVLADRVFAWKREADGIDVTIEAWRKGDLPAANEAGALLVVDKTENTFTVQVSKRPASATA